MRLTHQALEGAACHLPEVPRLHLHEVEAASIGHRLALPIVAQVVLPIIINYIRRSCRQANERKLLHYSLLLRLCLVQGVCRQCVLSRKRMEHLERLLG